MKIIIGGCGKIGATLLAALANEGHDVVAMDNDPDVVSYLTNIHDVMGVCGNAADCETLEDAGIADTDLFIAVTGSDEVNMLSCFLARKMGAGHTIARIRNPEYNDASLGFMKQALDLSMAINPELLAAKELFDLLKVPSAVKIESFAGRACEMVELHLKDDSPLDGMVLKDLCVRHKTKVLICVVQRGDEVHIPSGNFVLKSGDRIGLTASPHEIAKFLSTIGMMKRRAKKIMILGGGKTAWYLAKMLEESDSDIKIIDKNPDVCRELSETLKKAAIIHGDGSDHELLLAEGLRDTDAFIALTGMDEENILLSLYASQQKVPTVIPKINRNELISMAENLQLYTVISPKKVVSDLLRSYARALDNSKGSSNVETLYRLMDGSAEALEFNVGMDSTLTNIPLRHLELKPGILLAGIIRGRQTIVPGGNDSLIAGDKVVVIASGRRLLDLADILK